MAQAHILDTAAHRTGRLARACAFVVWVEGPRGWFELDGETENHACTLAANWVRPELGAIGASVRRVLPTGATKGLLVISPDLDFGD